MKLNKWMTSAALATSIAFSPLALAEDDPLKVGFVYVGPIGDHGWSYEHDQGRLELEKHFGSKVKKFEKLFLHVVNGVNTLMWNKNSTA